MDKMSPCKDCPNRQIGCHSKCEHYIEFKRLLNERNLKERIEKQIEKACWETIRRSKRR